MYFDSQNQIHTEVESTVRTNNKSSKMKFIVSVALLQLILPATMCLPAPVSTIKKKSVDGNLIVGESRKGRVRGGAAESPLLDDFTMERNLTPKEWSQIGQDIEGTVAYDESGKSISISSEGKTVAIGSPHGAFHGKTEVYHRNARDRWVKIGEDIEGGWSNSLSSDGTMLAVGYCGGVERYTFVKMFRLYNENWVKVGSDIVVEETGTFNARVPVSLSSDGNTVAIGIPGKTDDAAGQVRVYHLLSFGNFEQWTKIGENLDGEAAGDKSGYSVSLSEDGMTVAIGSPNNNGNSGNVRVYHLEDGGWIQMGSDIDGSDRSGWSISLSADGTTVAIGAPENDENGKNAGQVKIYRYDGHATDWIPFGNNIDGQSGDYSGKSVSLSADGATVAIGAPGDVDGARIGYVRIYRYLMGFWTQVATNIEGGMGWVDEPYKYPPQDDGFGSSVSLSADGNIVAIGAPFHNGYGPLTGHAQVYSLYPDGTPSPSASPSVAPTTSPSSTPSTSPITYNFDVSYTGICLGEGQKKYKYCKHANVTFAQCESAAEDSNPQYALGYIRKNNSDACWLPVDYEYWSNNEAFCTSLFGTAAEEDFEKEYYNIFFAQDPRDNVATGSIVSGNDDPDFTCYVRNMDTRSPTAAPSSSSSPSMSVAPSSELSSFPSSVPSSLPSSVPSSLPSSTPTVSFEVEEKNWLCTCTSRDSS